MKKMIFLAALLVSSSFAFAADRTEAFNKVCKGLYNETSKLSCMKTVKLFSYYQDSGLSICAGLYNEGNKIACLTHIGDKDFEGFEVEQCGSLYNDASKVQCLKDNGVARLQLPSCIKKDELVNLLKMSLDHLHAGNFSAVDSNLANLVNALGSCQ